MSARFTADSLPADYQAQVAAQLYAPATKPTAKPCTAKQHKVKKPKAATAAQARFIEACNAVNLPHPETEYRFCPDRLWRFDYAWPKSKVALEVDGGIWVNGGHNRGSQMLKTWEKENTAAAFYGWRILRCEPKRLGTTELMRFLSMAIGENRP